MNPRLLFDRLEARDVPTAALAAVADIDTPANHDLLIPVELSGGSTKPVTFTATSSTGQVGVQLLSGGRSLVLNVSGVDAAGVAFSGDLTLRLFESQSPLATARLINLAETGFYNGLTFHRVIQDFVAQGGDPNGNGTGGSTQPDFRDEFSANLTFNSEGLLAMANAGDDDNNSQFFITDVDLPLGQRPQNLNFNHTILGQLTGGRELFTRLIGTPTGANNKPSTPAVINTATVIADDTRGVLRITPAAGFTGNSTITVTGDDGSGASAPETFGVRVVADAENERAFLTPSTPTNLTTPAGTGISFRLNGTDLEGDPLTYVVRDANDFTAAPDNVTVSIDQATGTVTLSPDPNFVGTVQMRVGVRDGTARPSGSKLDAQSNFDTDLITLTVAGAIDLNLASDTGALNDDNVTSATAPGFTVAAPAGSTVTLTANGKSVTASETRPGVFSAALPEGALVAGVNTVTAAANTGGTTSDLGSLSVTFAPPLLSLYTVPGAFGSEQSIDFEYFYKETDFRNEVGIVLVDDASGTIDGVAPGDAGYVRAAMQSSSRQILFGQDDKVGGTKTVTLFGGQRAMFYIVSNDNATTVIAQSLFPNAGAAASVFFSVAAANPEGLNHVGGTDDPLASQASYTFEDLPGGGDKDYNDAVLIAKPSAATVSEAVRVAAQTTRAVSLAFTLEQATKAKTNAAASLDKPATAGGEVGLFAVDNAAGRIGTLDPGSPGYVQAALSRRVTLFGSDAAPGAAASSTQSGGGFLGFYYIPGTTATDFLTKNPSNDPAGSAFAYLSFDAANPDKLQHVRNFAPEGVDRGVPVAGEPFRVHFMGTLNGGPADFDDAVISFRQGS